MLVVKNTFLCQECEEPCKVARPRAASWDAATALRMHDEEFAVRPVACDEEVLALAANSPVVTRRTGKLQKMESNSSVSTNDSLLPASSGASVVSWADCDDEDLDVGSFVSSLANFQPTAVPGARPAVRRSGAPCGGAPPVRRSGAPAGGCDRRSAVQPSGRPTGPVATTSTTSVLCGISEDGDQAAPIQAGFCGEVSRGSLNHPLSCGGACKYFSKGKCKDGADCSRCHLCQWSSKLHGKERRKKAAKHFCGTV